MDKKRINEFRARAAALVAQMTLEEKLSMLTTHHNAVERLGIGEFYIGTEVARGYVGREPEKISTVFPQPVGLAATFDSDLMYKLGEIAANESRAYYNEEKKGGIALWGPTVDMARDPRWGRNEEEYGEDVCLTGVMTAAYTKGMLGDNGSFVKTIPTLKHFCADNNEENRGGCNAYLPPRLKHEYYYAAFETPIRDGGARSIMAAYNEINGCPAIMNSELQTILKDDWGLWFVVSDGGDFTQNVTIHKICRNHSEALKLSLRAGADSITDGEDVVRRATEKALADGLITEADIDKTVTNTFTARFALGQFDDCEYNNIDKSVIDCAEYREINRKAADEQIVLLKNSGILPLKTVPKKIAVLGPLADENLMDWYTGYSSGDISVLEGIKREFPDSEVIHDSLWDIVSIKAPNGKYFSAKENGEIAADADTAGESELFELQDWGENWNNLFSVKYKRYVRLYDDNTFRLHNRRIYDWFTRETLNLRKQGDRYLIEEFLHHRRMTCDDSGRLSVRKINNITSDQLFEIHIEKSGRERAAEAAENSGFVLYCVGNYPVQVAKECYDRKTLALNIQCGMAGFISEINPNTAMAVISSYPYSITEENEKVPAILWSSHAGAYLGTAVAGTVSGRNNPAGRLAQTWYRTENELPDILNYDIENAGTTYMYFKGEALYPFGYGLSYSAFSYGSLSVNACTGGFTAEIDITNISDTDGDEVVEIYFSVPDSKVSRPIKKLCGFERRRIRAGSTEKFSIFIPQRILEIYNVRNGESLLESGEYVFAACSSSADVRTETKIHICGGEFGQRSVCFGADTFDSAEGITMDYSLKLGRHYLKSAGWSGTAVYSGINPVGKKKLKLFASSVFAPKEITLKWNESSETTTAKVITSDAFDDFRQYEADLPENLGSEAKLSVTVPEGVCLLSLEI